MSDVMKINPASPLGHDVVVAGLVHLLRVTGGHVRISAKDLSEIKTGAKMRAWIEMGNSTLVISLNDQANTPEWSPLSGDQMARALAHALHKLGGEMTVGVEEEERYQKPDWEIDVDKNQESVIYKLLEGKRDE